MKIKAEISKSQYIKGKQCPKALWLYRHRKDLASEVDEATQAVFDQGHEIGLLAQEYFKKGIEVEGEYWDIEGAIETTNEYIKDGHTIIFEACACSKDGLYSKIDVLKKVKGKDEWDLIEVKGSTSVKDYQVDDMAAQRYAFEGAGYKIRKSILMYLNKEYYRDGELDLKELFVLEDCTDIVLEAMKEVPLRLEDLKKVLRKKKEPEVAIGKRCSDPFGCDYAEYCWAHVPQFSIYDITSSDKKIQALLEQDVLDVKDLPDDFKLGNKKALDVQCYKSNTIHKDVPALKEWVKELNYPLYFLDYETIAPAIPPFDGMRPYGGIPFQFSLHIQHKKGGPLTHLEYIHTEQSDPRLPFAKALIEACGNEGSIVVYNQPFEAGVNNKLAEFLPQFSKEIQAINDRMVDLLVPFKQRMLYHPEQQCSASIKAVLPSFCPDFSYDDLDIGDGMTASREGQAIIQGKLPADEIGPATTRLSEYCSLDSEAMHELLKVIYKTIGQ